MPTAQFLLGKISSGKFVRPPPPRPTGYDDKIPHRDRVKLTLSERLSNSL